MDDPGIMEPAQMLLNAVVSGNTTSLCDSLPAGAQDLFMCHLHIVFQRLFGKYPQIQPQNTPSFRGRCPRQCAGFHGVSLGSIGVYMRYSRLFRGDYWTRLDGVKRVNGGGRGIRTPGTLTGTTVFKTAGFNRSPIPPRAGISQVYSNLRSGAGVPQWALPPRSVCRYLPCSSSARALAP